jgi:hypothetical protein
MNRGMGNNVHCREHHPLGARCGFRQKIPSFATMRLYIWPSVGLQAKIRSRFRNSELSRNHRQTPGRSEASDRLIPDKPDWSAGNLVLLHVSKRPIDEIASTHREKDRFTPVDARTAGQWRSLGPYARLLQAVRDYTENFADLLLGTAGAADRAGTKCDRRLPKWRLPRSQLSCSVDEEEWIVSITGSPSSVRSTST